MKADKNDYTPDEKIRFFDTVLNLNILNKGDPAMGGALHKPEEMRFMDA